MSHEGNLKQYYYCVIRINKWNLFLLYIKVKLSKKADVFSVLDGIETMTYPRNSKRPGFTELYEVKKS